MKLTTTITLTLAMLVAFAAIAVAHPVTPRVDRREARQELRIRHGWRSGELTRRETARLRAGERHIRRMEWRAKADGRVTPRERARLNRALNRESRAIRRLKHNARMR
jgi:hypothetical protein